MPDAPVFSSETQPSLQQLIDYFVDSLFDEKRVKQLQTAVTNGGAEALTIADAAASKVLDPALALLGAFLAGIEKHIEKVAGPALGGVAGHLIGRDVSISELRRAAAAGGDNPLGATIAKLATDALSPRDGDLQPGSDNAQRLLATLAQLVFNGWFETVAFELVTTMVPGADSFESVAELPHNLIDALGLGRLARTALRPLAQIGVATPLEWELHKRHRPTLLPAAGVIRQFMRGAWAWADVAEELQRHGYSDARIAALLNEQRKFESVGDVSLLLLTGGWQNDQALQYLRDQGYDEDAAVLALRVEGQRRFRSLETAEADALVAAYADRRIDGATFAGALAAHVPVESERNLVAELADLRLATNVRHLSPAEARECVLAGILAVTDYETALRQAGYDAFAVDALELLLRQQLDAKRTADEHRQQLAADRAAAAAAKVKAAAEKKAEIDAARVLKQRGSIAALEQAYIRGLIPIERLAEVLTPDFDADTVKIYLADVEDRRHAYIAQQQHAADAAKRAANRGLTVGELQQALAEGVLTVDEIRPQLVARGLSEADVSVLLHTMQDAAAAKQHAAALRAKAQQNAQTKTLSLSQAEALVKGGHWTMAQFDVFLRTLGYNAADVAALHGLLADTVAKQRAAAAIVAGATAAGGAAGLTLAQVRRGVVLGAVTIEDFQQYLVSQRYSAAAIAILVADAQDAANTARAAQARRDAATPASDGRGVSLSTLTRAAQLGIVSTADYATALQGLGYSDADIALELDLLAAEIASAKTPAPAAGSAEAALASGTTTPAAGAQLKHVQVDGELAARGLSLATVEKSVKAGDTTIESYTNWLEANGYGHGDAEILTALLAAQLAG
jgi:hypothetical protein